MAEPEVATPLTREQLQRAVDEPPNGLAWQCARARSRALGVVGVATMTLPVGTVEVLLAAAERLLAVKPASDEEIQSALEGVPGADVCTWGEGVEQGFYSGVRWTERRLLAPPVETREE
jgi:hypothetical protein